jgi:hypothetical protein
VTQSQHLSNTPADLCLRGPLEFDANALQMRHASGLVFKVLHSATLHTQQHNIRRGLRLTEQHEQFNEVRTSDSR